MCLDATESSDNLLFVVQNKLSLPVCNFAMKSELTSLLIQLEWSITANVLLYVMFQRHPAVTEIEEFVGVSCPDIYSSRLVATAPTEGQSMGILIKEEFVQVSWSITCSCISMK